MTLFDAGLLAQAWLSVAVASAKDGNRAVLDRTVCLEGFHEGLRVSATDGYLLLTSWVPNVDHDFGDAPGLDVRPYTSAVAMDPHGRARGLLGHALGLAVEAEKAGDLEEVLVSVELGVVDLVDAEPGVLPGMDPTWVTVEVPDRERVKLRVYDGEFPSWRKVLASHRPQRTAGVALAAERMDQLAKLAKRQTSGLGVLRFEFGGESEGVLVSGSHPPVEGLVMPVRWDFDADAPLDPPGGAAAGDEGDVDEA